MLYLALNTHLTSEISQFHSFIYTAYPQKKNYLIQILNKFHHLIAFNSKKKRHLLNKVTLVSICTGDF